MTKRLPTPSERLDELEALHEYSVSPVTREIYLSGESDSADGTEEPGVDYLMAARYIKNLHWLEAQSDEPIIVHMKTCGGFEEEGFAIYDATRFSPCYVTIVSHTPARSMSSIILQAGDRRLLMPNSYVLLHWGTMDLSGSFKSVLSHAEFAKKQEQRFLDVYVDRMGHGAKWKTTPVENIREILQKSMAVKDDVFYTPEEAVDWGLADAVIEDSGWRDL